ncbi:MAG: VWA domain-containing protein [Myxococcota bacterium]|nr:VWA domain-containing protein [Myxococcota bacterium]
MNDLHFANPDLVYLVWAWLAFIAVLILLERRGSEALDRLVGSVLHDQLVDRPANWRRWTRIGLIGIAGLFMIVALMRPQWGMRHIATPRVGAEIMIALDVSRSMLADDAKPSRLERAKAEIADLLAYLEDDHVGLIAFAGRATVLSPMTPDKSFLRLALDNTGPHSVTRGGTRLAEPILRAVAGMGEAGPSQRALILITDGEDHDSFALDAAKVAGEAGIKIIAIGFGDESGSEVYITDRRSGARTLLRDGDGNPVLSRLDGDMLRGIALATDGAYVPAGTGVLDLASIYDAHIARLTRSQLDSRGKIIRDEIYQWFVLLALICLTAAVASAGGPARVNRLRKSASLGMLTILLTLNASGARAQSLPQELEEEAALEEALEAPDDADASTPTETPRERYNLATALLSSEDPTAASVALRDARRDATDDLELRYAATYNLGMAAVAHAETVEAEDPHAALDSLYEAADWFRDATRQRADGEDEDARHNLDVALRKALVLADFLARQNEQTVEAELDALVESQRERTSANASLLEAVVRGGELDASETLRPAFASEATEQRTLTADANSLAERIAHERDAIAIMTEEERTPQDAMRGAQLDATLQFLDAGIERMGQARRQLRQRRAERAYRRNSAALAQLKRARDQLRDPVEQIGVLLGEVGGLMQSTSALHAASSGASRSGTAQPVVLPAFLSQESTSEEATSLSHRVDELAMRLELGLERSSGPSAGPDNPEQQALLEAVTLAAPFVGKASELLTGTVSPREEAEYELALEAEIATAQALAEARERFFDLKQLIEASHTDEQRIAALATSDEPEVAEHRDEYADAMRDLQHKNIERGERLEGKIQDAARAVEAQASDGEAAAATAPGTSPPPTPEQLEQEAQRLELAGEMLTGALSAMDDANQALDAGANSGNVAWPEVSRAAKRAEQNLEAMRRLFFSIVEHVRELARKQVDLSDRTTDSVALAAPDAQEASAADVDINKPDTSRETEEPGEPAPAPRSPETLARTSALAPEQSSLAERAGLIGDALAQQSESTAAQPAEPSDSAADPEAAERLRRAAEHVVSAQLAMQAAAGALDDPDAPLAPVPDHQSSAIQELQKALAALEPPQQQNEQNEQEKQEQQQEEQDEQPQPGENTEPEREQDPAQLLQGVRDREAERRRERERRDAASRNQPVDRDW